MISVQNVTKQFLNGKGLFDVTFQVEEGEVFGYLRLNGAGKSKTILMSSHIFTEINYLFYL